MTQKTEGGNATDLLDLYGPVLHRYTRAEAVEDGLIVEVSDAALLAEAGIRFKVGMSKELYEEHVQWTGADNREGRYQDERGRLWDVLYMYATACRKLRQTTPGSTTSELLFTVYMVPRDPEAGTEPLPVALRATVGPNDDLSPVVLLRTV